MQEWTEIRRKVLVEKISKRQIRRDYHVGHETLKRILENPQPPGYRKQTPRPKTKLGPFIGVIEEILERDKDAPRKQRHTAKRIFHRLQDEYGYEGGYTQVKEAIALRKRHSGDVHMPLSHPPGEGQFDFGQSQVIIAGRQQKAHFVAVALPHSSTYFLKAYPRENTETFQDAHRSAFEFFGGVCTKMTYDNTSIAVSKIAGRMRDLTRGFLAVQSHYLFDAHFCTPASGNEKGNVEGAVGYGRRNWMVPIPHFASWSEFNAYLARRCTEDLDRVLWGKTQTKGELLAADQAAMLPLPKIPFEARRIEVTRSNSLSLVRFDRNAYSVPTAFAFHEVSVTGGMEQVLVAAGGTVIAVHPRSWEKEGVFYDPRHYLALLERKPGALDFARPLEEWDLPACYDILRRRLEGSLGYAGTRAFIKVLRMLEGASVHQLAGAIRYALKIGATAPEAIELILRRQIEAPVALFALDGHPHLRPYGIEAPDLSPYATLIGA
jgi:transposase